jgi:hypothetical protein
MCRWPLGDPARWADGEMINLLGEDAFDWERHLIGGGKLHLYGKRAAAVPALAAPETWPSRELKRDRLRPAASADVTRATGQQSTRHTNETHQVSQELVVDGLAQCSRSHWHRRLDERASRKP